MMGAPELERLQLYIIVYCNCIRCAHCIQIRDSEMTYTLPEVLLEGLTARTSCQLPGLQ